jgi:hypothetical protein
MPLARDQDVIQALAPQCPDQALNIWMGKEGEGIAPKEGKDNFERTHDQLDKRSGSDHDPVGSRPGERSGLGGGPGGGNDPEDQTGEPRIKNDHEPRHRH